MPECEDLSTMVNRNLIRTYEPPADELNAAFGMDGDEWLPLESQRFEENRVLTGRVLQVTDEGVLVDVGSKSEGVIELREWYNEEAGQVVPPRPGDEVQCLVLSLEDESGTIVLSYRKARWQRAWEAVLSQHKEGD